MKISKWVMPNWLPILLQFLSSCGILPLNDPVVSAMVPTTRTLPADLSSLDRGAALRPGLVQTLEVEQAFGEVLIEGDEGFGGGGHGAGDRSGRLTRQRV